MKKLFLLTGIFALMSISTLQAQVRIGENKVPEKGAILDLNGTSYKGGLLLPKVIITDMEKIPDTFSDGVVQGAETVAALAGLIVWNANPGSEGIYVWDGEKWRRMMEVVTPVIDPAILPLGAGSLSGRTCFDIGVTEDVNTRGYISGRWIADFAKQSSYDYIYTAVENITNLRFMVVDKEGCVVNYTSTGTGNLASGETATLKVNFKPTLNSNPNIITRLRTNPAQVKIYAVYKKDTTEVAVPLTANL